VTGKDWNPVVVGERAAQSGNPGPGAGVSSTERGNKGIGWKVETLLGSACSMG
jgi:hypothetical protein